MSDRIDLIIRRCAKQDMYDDNGYCEHKIKKSEGYYTRVVPDGNCDNHCSECMLQMIIVDKERDFRYQDDWFLEHKMFCDAEKLIKENRK